MTKTEKGNVVKFDEEVGKSEDEKPTAAKGKAPGKGVPSKTEMGELANNRADQILHDFALELDEKQKEIEKIKADMEKKMEPIKAQKKALRKEARKKAGRSATTVGHFEKMVYNARKAKEKFDQKPAHVKEEIKNVLATGEFGQYQIDWDAIAGVK